MPQRPAPDKAPSGPAAPRVQGPEAKTAVQGLETCVFGACARGAGAGGDFCGLGCFLGTMAGSFLLKNGACSQRGAFLTLKNGACSEKEAFLTLKNGLCSGQEAFLTLKNGACREKGRS